MAPHQLPSTEPMTDVQLKLVQNREIFVEMLRFRRLTSAEQAAKIKEVEQDERDYKNITLRSAPGLIPTTSREVDTELLRTAIARADAAEDENKRLRRENGALIQRCEKLEGLLRSRGRGPNQAVSVTSTCI